MRARLLRMLHVLLLLPVAATVHAPRLRGAAAARPQRAGRKTADSSRPVLLPPGPRLRDLAAARQPPLLFGTDLLDSFPFPATGNPADCKPAGNTTAPGCSAVRAAAAHYSSCRGEGLELSPT